MKTPAGLLAPLEECRFELEGEERERLEELRREKAEKARRGKLDFEGREAHHERETKKAAASRIRKIGPNEWADGIGDDWAPGEFEAFCERMRREQGELKEAVKRSQRPLIRAGGEVNATANGMALPGRKTSDELGEADQKALDYCHRVAPEGCRTVSLAEIGQELGYTEPGAWKVVGRLKARGLWLDGWTAKRGQKSGAEPKRTPTTLDELQPAVRKIHDTFERLSPGGCRPVRQSEVCAELGISPTHVCKAVSLLRAAGLFRPEWESVGKHVPKKPPTEKPANPSAAPKSSPAPPPDSPAARGLVAHASKSRITPEERRLRERDADRSTPVACEMAAASITATPQPEPAAAMPPWKRRALSLHDHLTALFRALPEDLELARTVLHHAQELIAR